MTKGANTHGSDLASNFDFSDLISEWKGYVSSVDKTKVGMDVLTYGSQNVYKKLSGTITVRQGQKRQGVANTTVSAVSSKFVWNTSWGTTFTMVVSNSTLYVVSNKLWYPLQTGLTKTRYVFDKWWDNSAKKDKVLFVNGTADMQEWGGGFGLISSTTANTIVLDRTIAASMIPSASGTVIVNGTTYTYTGSSGSTLTGVTPTPVGEAAASGVLQPVINHANTPAAGFLADFLKVINNQVYVGSYTSRLIYMSQDTDFTNYVVPTPQIAGSPGLFVMDGVAKGIGVRQGKASIGFGSGGWAVISFTLTSNNSVITRTNTIDIKPVAILQAPYAHEFIDSVGDNLVYLGQDQQVHVFGDFNTAFVAVYPTISQEVATELSVETFTGGGLKCVGEYIYITAPNSGKVYLRQERTRVDDNGTVVSEKLWHPPFIWNATFIDQIDGVVVSFSNANPQIYEVWGTGQWHDDSPSGDPLSYKCVMALGYRGESRRQGMWNFDKIYTEGYMTRGTNLNLQVNYDYEGATNAINVPINSGTVPVKLFQTALASLGDNSLGDESLGQGGIADPTADPNGLPKFKNIKSLALTNCFEWQPIYSSEQVDAQWEIIAIASNAVIASEQQATFLINKVAIN